MRLAASGTSVLASTLLVTVLVGTACSAADSESVDQKPAARSEASNPDLPPVLAAALIDGPVRPRTARQTATQLIAAESAIADATTPPRVVRIAGQVQQLAYRQLGSRPAWDERVQSLLPGRLRRVVRDNVRVRREFRSMHRTLASKLPAWRIVAPLSARRLRGFYREAERRSRVEWEYLAAINLVETGFGRITGTSTAGAQGPMQFLPSTWATWGNGGDIHDPHDAILAAGRFLAHYGFARNPGAALFRYNNSMSYVRGVTGLAEIMKRRPRAYLGYHAWRIYYLTTRGDVLLPLGYSSTRPIPVDDWLADHPQQRR